MKTRFIVTLLVLVLLPILAFAQATPVSPQAPPPVVKAEAPAPVPQVSAEAQSAYLTLEIMKSTFATRVFAALQKELDSLNAEQGRVIAALREAQPNFDLAQEKPGAPLFYRAKPEPTKGEAPALKKEQ